MSKTTTDLTSRWTGGPYYLTPEQRRRTREMFQRKAKRIVMPPVNYTFCPNCGADMRKKGGENHETD